MTADAGTFDVRADRGLVRAYVVDGTIALVGRADQGGTIAAPAGHLLAVQANEVAIRKLDDPLTFTGWHSGMLQFDNVPVMAAAHELNRYRRRPIRIADGRVAGMRISGAFRPAETPAFVDALTTGFPVRVQQDDKAGIVIAAR
jgi:transmembrane sensor